MQVSNQIIEVLDYLCSKIGITIDWTESNVLPYVQTLLEKYIAWEIGSNIFWCIIGIGFIILGIIFYKITIKFKNKYEKTGDIDYEVLYIFTSIAFVIVLVIGVIMELYNIYDIIKCVTFPELKIYEYITMNIS